MVGCRPWMQALLLALVAAFALLGARPAAAPHCSEALLAAFPLPVEICHDGDSMPAGSTGNSCLLCHLVAAASPAVAGCGAEFTSVRATRLALPPPSSPGGFRPLVILRARGPPGFAPRPRVNPGGAPVRLLNPDRIVKFTLFLGAPPARSPCRPWPHHRHRPARPQRHPRSPRRTCASRLQLRRLPGRRGPRRRAPIAALSRGPWAHGRPGQWEACTAALPSLADLPDVGMSTPAPSRSRRSSPPGPILPFSPPGSSTRLARACSRSRPRAFRLSRSTAMPSRLRPIPSRRPALLVLAVTDLAVPCGARGAAADRLLAVRKPAESELDLGAGDHADPGGGGAGPCARRLEPDGALAGRGQCGEPGARHRAAAAAVLRAGRAADGGCGELYRGARPWSHRRRCACTPGRGRLPVGDG